MYDDSDSKEREITIWGSLLKFTKYYIRNTIVVVVVSFGVSSLNGVSVGELFSLPVLNSKLASNYGTAYTYDSSKDKVETLTKWVDTKKVYDKDNKEVASDRAYDTRELIEEMDSNIGQRVCITDPNNALRITEHSIQIKGSSAYVNVSIQNNLPIELQSINAILVVHYNGTVYFEIPFSVEDINVKPYGNYEVLLTRDIKGFESKIPPNVKFSLAASYLR